MRSCPECEMMLTPGHARCPACDTAVGETGEACDRCGETLSASATGCPACGHLKAEGRCDRHPDRPAAGRCALCGQTLCEECDRGGRSRHLCETHAQVPMIEGWAEILSLPDEVEAQLIVGNLQAEGIDSRIFSQKDHFAIPVEFGDLARVRVLVPAFAYGEAERILAGHRDVHGEVSFGCPSCGEPYEEGEKVCGGCGKPLA